MKKCLGEAQWLFLGSAALVFGFCWIRVWVVSMLEMSRFASVVAPLWDKWGHFSPVPLEDVLSYPGRVALTFVEPIVVFTVSIWAIARGSDAVSGELSRGTMEMLLAQPVSRLQTLVVQAFVTVAGVALLCLLCLAGVWMGIELNTIEEPAPRSVVRVPLFGEFPNPFAEPELIETPMSNKVQASQMTPAVFNLFALGFGVAGLTTFFSACDRYRWRTVGLASAVYVLQFVIKGFALSTPDLMWMKQFTFFAAFEPQWFVSVAIHHPDHAWAWRLLSEGGEAAAGPMAYNSILLGLGVAGYLAAAAIFCRRDLPAPL